MTKSDVVRDYRREFPEVPTNTLAKLIYKDDKNKLLFKDVEDVRSRLRYIEGKAGKKNVKHVKDSEFFKEEARVKNPYKLPESDETIYEHYIIEPKGVLGVISDIHVPYHSMSAVTAMIDYFKENTIDTLLINGDLFDFYGASRFLKDPRKRKVSEEIEIGCDLLKIFKKELNCKIIFKGGNHDSRLEHYMWQKQGDIFQISELQEIKDITIYNLMKKRLDFDFEYVEHNRIINYCGLLIIHGHETGNSVFSPVNIARGLQLRAKQSAMCGHHHRTSEHTERMLGGEIFTTWSLGSLCELNPDYLPINNWNHGFARIEALSENSYHVNNLRIHNGKIY